MRIGHRTFKRNGDKAMFTILVMLLLIIIAGWLDSRLNWRQTAQAIQKEKQR